MKTVEEIQKKITTLEKLAENHKDLKAKALNPEVMMLHHKCMMEFKVQIEILNWVLNENRT